VIGIFRHFRNIRDFEPVLLSMVTTGKLIKVAVDTARFSCSIRRVSRLNGSGRSDLNILTNLNKTFSFDPLGEEIVSVYSQNGMHVIMEKIFLFFPCQIECNLLRRRLL
jgi:hypothetical protein